MSDDLSSLTIADKRAIVGELLSKARKAIPATALSAGQLRLWQAAQIQGPTPVHNISILYWLDGPLNSSALVQALELVVARHGSLRTTFIMQDRSPIQRIPVSALADIAVIDKSNVAPEKWRITVRGLAEQEAKEPFDLSRGPLCRFRLWQRSDRQFALSVTVHHIVADRWSLSILARELGDAYPQQASARPASMTPSLQYADYVLWQRNFLQGALAAEQLDYWRQAGAGDIDCAMLPSAEAGGSRNSGGRYTFTLDPVISSRVHGFAQQMTVTPYIILLSAYAVLLHEITGGCRLLICAPVAGRHRPESRGVIGYFNNLLPLYLDLTGNPEFGTVLARAKQTGAQRV